MHHERLNPSVSIRAHPLGYCGTCACLLVPHRSTLQRVCRRHHVCILEHNRQPCRVQFLLRTDPLGSEPGRSQWIETASPSASRYPAELALTYAPFNRTFPDARIFSPIARGDSGKPAKNTANCSTSSADTWCGLGVLFSRQPLAQRGISIRGQILTKVGFNRANCIIVERRLPGSHRPHLTGVTIRLGRNASM